MMQKRMHIPLFLIALTLVAAVACGGRENRGDEGDNTLFTAPATYPAFSGDRAMELLERQVDFGPRVPGSPAHDSCLAFFMAYFDGLGLDTHAQRFSLPGYDKTLDLTNVIVRINHQSSRRILLAAHWDSRPWADMEPDPDRARRAVPGANDGASGVAVLMQAAAVFAEHTAPVGVDIVLFDGEDYGREGDESMFLLGSRYYAVTLGNEHRPMFGILLDLVGDRDAVFPREAFSRQYAHDIQDLVWKATADLRLTTFSDQEHSPILDDHVPLNTVAGIKTVNIIDAAHVGHDRSSERRRYWHTIDDLPHHCSASTLEEVGTLLMYLVYGLTGGEA